MQERVKRELQRLVRALLLQQELRELQELPEPQEQMPVQQWVRELPEQSRLQELTCTPDVSDHFRIRRKTFRSR